MFKSLIFLTLVLFISCSNKNINSTSNKIAKAYLELKNSLVKNEPLKVKEYAVNLIGIIDSAEETKFKNLKNSLLIISNTESIDKQRDEFYNLSKLVYNIYSENNDSGIVLYKQYCPMAFDDTGAYWLSDSQRILNPYFGSQMLHCGSVDEEIE